MDRWMNKLLDECLCGWMNEGLVCVVETMPSCGSTRLDLFSLDLTVINIEMIKRYSCNMHLTTVMEPKTRGVF
jgi:hypothetical protein